MAQLLGAGYSSYITGSTSTTAATAATGPVHPDVGGSPLSGRSFRSIGAAGDSSIGAGNGSGAGSSASRVNNEGLLVFLDVLQAYRPGRH